MPAETILQLKEQLLQLLIKDAYFREKIILSSGKESDYYIDARLVTLDPRGAYLTAKIMLDMVKKDSMAAIGGPTLGADPLVGALGVVGLEMGMDFQTFIIRKAPKSHGKQKQIEGKPLKPGSRVVLIDDVATTGKAFLQSLDVLEPMKVKVLKALCIVDRGEGAKEALAKRGCQMVPIFDVSQIHK